MLDHLTVDIDNKLKELSSTPSKPLIFRVGDHLRSRNPKAYDPEIIAIGPLHRGNEKLRGMEQHKLRCLKLLLERCKESSVERFVTAIRHLEDKARKCYAEDIQLDPDELVRMLILDGCFIIEFLRKYGDVVISDEDDPIFQYEYSYLLRDLMVFENQIPFLIIDSLFKMIYNGDIDYLIYPLIKVQLRIFPVQYLPEFPRASSNAHHLLGIVHDSIMGPSFESHTVSLLSPNSRSISSAVVLEKAGISFQKSERDHEFKIAFENKAMKIPELEISDSTESLFQNLIAYEHYHCTGGTQKYVSDYVFFMRCLVHSPEDAEVLRRSGIICNPLGSNEMVYSVINQLGKNITISDEFPYSGIFNDVNRHCADIRNTWMATLRRVHFNSPWTAISVFAASTLLLLTITQTTFAILSYSNDLKKGN